MCLNALGLFLQTTYTTVFLQQLRECKGNLLYRDFVLLLLCYIVRSCVIVVLRVYGCACAVNAEHEE